MHKEKWKKETEEKEGGKNSKMENILRYWFKCAMRLALNVVYIWMLLADVIIKLHSSMSISMKICIMQQYNHNNMQQRQQQQKNNIDKIITLKVVFLSCKGDLLVIFIHRIAYTHYTHEIPEYSLQNKNNKIWLSRQAYTQTHTHTDT